MSKSVLGLFQKKIVIEDINGKFQEGRVKVVGIPGGYTNIEEKTYISRGSMQKNGKFQGVTVNLTGNPEGPTSKKSISSTGGGGYNFFLETFSFFCR